MIAPDGDVPAGEDRVNMKSFYDMFRHTYSHDLVSLPFLEAIHYYFDTTDQHLIKNTLAELYRNLSYITLSGGRDFGFNNVSDLLARISLLKKVPVCKTLKKWREKTEKMLVK